jgi:hypothetical protein
LGAGGRYWGFDWADNWVRVTSFDAANGIISSDPQTPPLYGYNAKARFFAANLLSELDIPGELGKGQEKEKEKKKKEEEKTNYITGISSFSRFPPHSHLHPDTILIGAPGSCTCIRPRR